jgi:hypothetical protein
MMRIQNICNPKRMKRSAIFAIVGAVVVLGGGVAWYFFGPKVEEKTGDEAKSAETAWIFDRTVPEALSGTNDANTGTVLGDLEANRVSFDIPKGSFDDGTTVTLVSPDSVPDYDGDTMTPLGAPIEISSDTARRLNEPATVTFRFDPVTLPEGDEIYSVRVAYYDGSTWEYVRPTEVDKERGLVTLETYHFSLLAPTKLESEQKITEDWIHSAALDSVLRDDVNGRMDHVAEQIADMILGKMGISDESTRGTVLKELMTSDSYKEIYDTYKSGDITGASEKIALLAGEKIAANVPDSVFKEALGSLGDASDDIAAVSQAAGYAAEGQYKEAARIIGEQIADKFLITTAGKIAVQVIDGQIESWKNGEVEAAYEAYKNGADGVFWGYNVDKGDFDGVWLQMRGIRRQLELEAIRRENDAREEAGMPELSERQEELVRAAVKERYRKQFAKREKQDEAIEKAENDLRILVDAFKDRDLFSDSLGPDGLDKGYDYEQKLDILNHFAKKIMRDTERFELSDKDVTIKEGAITGKSIALGASIYFSEPDGKKKYAEYLQRNFGIDPWPNLKDMKGSWNGTMTITDVDVPESMLPDTDPGESDDEDGEQGCDLSIDLRDMIGKPVPLSLNITPNGETGGTLSFATDDSDPKDIPFTYQDGVISAGVSEQGGTGTMTLTASRGDDSHLALEGPFVIVFRSDQGEAKITAAIQAKK